MADVLDEVKYEQKSGLNFGLMWLSITFRVSYTPFMSVSSADLENDAYVSPVSVCHLIFLCLVITVMDRIHSLNCIGTP